MDDVSLMIAVPADNISLESCWAANYSQRPSPPSNVQACTFGGNSAYCARIALLVHL